MKTTEQLLNDAALRRVGFVGDGLEYSHKLIGSWPTFVDYNFTGKHPDAPFVERIIADVWERGLKTGREQKANEIKHALGA